MTLHKSHSLKHGTTVLAGLSNCTLQMAAEVDNEVTSGSHFPQIVVVRGQAPKVSVASRAIADFLDVTGSTGAVIDNTDSLVVVFAKLGDDGLPVAGSAHRSYAFDKGLLLPKSIKCEHQKDAEIDAEASFLSSDGATAPITIADDAALPTIGRDNKRWTLGPIAIGGVTIGLPKSLDITFGGNVTTEGSSSNVFDTLLQQDGVKPVISVTGLNATQFAAAGVPINGKAATHANTTIYLRKRAEDGIGFVADATEEHIAITAAGVLVVEQHSTSGTNRGELQLKLTCGWDGTNAPIVIDTTAALPS